MKYIRDYYGVPAKRGMPAAPKVGTHAGRRGVIRGTRNQYIVITDKPGRYSWWVVLHPHDVEYFPSSNAD